MSASLQTQQQSIHQPQTPIGQQRISRVLKIEKSGDFWKGITKPKIRLMGHWLEQAGFKPGNHVEVLFIAPGVIELRTPEALNPQRTNQPKLEQLSLSF